MEKIAVCLLLVLLFLIGNAQERFSIITRPIKPKADVSDSYIYKPAQNITIPEKIQALVVYRDKKGYVNKTIALKKSGEGYKFSFKAPRATSVLIVSIIEPGNRIADKSSFVMEKKIVFDNNNEEGYTIFLNDKSGKRYPYTEVDLIGLMQYAGWYQWGLREKPDSLFTKMYENAYKLNPRLKKHESYLEYLFLKYKQDGTTFRPQLIEYATTLLRSSKEDDLKNALRIYNRLKMTEEKDQLSERILKNFPNGEFAKENYWSEYSWANDTTEMIMLTNLNAYTLRFNDHSPVSKDRFYHNYVHISFAKKDWTSASKYTDLLNNRVRAGSTYDYYAWKLSGKQTDNPGSDLEIAKLLSARSIAISNGLLKDSANIDEGSFNEAKDFHYNYYDTYALILYKLGSYDSAFYYQELTSKQGKELNTSGMERYAAYAEKVKGIEFTRNYIETKLLAGEKSPVMLKQLLFIYKQLNFPEDEFSRLQEKSRLLVKQKNEAAIIAKYGTLKARDFSLKNMAGDTVSLAELKNKIVVMDFWATWCSPCKASFPAMQELVNKYKDDQDIVFLFIDTWESGPANKVKQEVIKYMQDNNYSFNVLFDVDNKASAAYKVDGIPHKIVIDKKGNLLYAIEKEGMSATDPDIFKDFSLAIEMAKKN